MTEPLHHPPSSATVSPLAVVLAFIALIEAIATYALTHIDGLPQLLLVGFVVVFPLLVGGCFFGILWTRPQVFYPPSEFGAIDPTIFARAMSRNYPMQTDPGITLPTENGNTTTPGTRAVPVAVALATEVQTETSAEFDVKGGKNGDAGVDTRVSSVSSIRQELNLLANRVSGLESGRFFDYVYRLIYGSQIELLLAMESSLDGLVSADVQRYVDSHIARWRTTNQPTVATTPELFLTFLTRSQLVQIGTNGKYQLTNWGREFLNYVRNWNLSLVKPFS